MGKASADGNPGNLPSDFPSLLLLESQMAGARDFLHTTRYLSLALIASVYKLLSQMKSGAGYQSPRPALVAHFYPFGGVRFSAGSPAPGALCGGFHSVGWPPHRHPSNLCVLTPQSAWGSASFCCVLCPLPLCKAHPTWTREAD